MKIENWKKKQAQTEHFQLDWDVDMQRTCTHIDCQNISPNIEFDRMTFFRVQLFSDLIEFVALFVKISNEIQSDSLPWIVWKRNCFHFWIFWQLWQPMFDICLIHISTSAILVLSVYICVRMTYYFMVFPCKRFFIYKLSLFARID